MRKAMMETQLLNKVNKYKKNTIEISYNIIKVFNVTFNASFLAK